ncbi:hypothetical protein [Pseudochryseolinea flava]|uniref:Uncharacterized protein n=1 Tax=Pseudochryseolinea flava TaxID=2059302 RepID=A0A364XZ84_9BACT|nr:hypothetical protein [Pseudochryseolinea flava]RAV98751.1 hypothetical protein DQQ10_22300 [Pseudochryseolinea flava]
MAACEPIVLSDISEEIFNNVKRDLSAAGFNLTGTSGTVDGPFGIVIRYAWNQPTSVLEIEIVEKSFFISCNQIKDKLYEAFDKYATR